MDQKQVTDRIIDIMEQLQSMKGYQGSDEVMTLWNDLHGEMFSLASQLTHENMEALIGAMVGTNMASFQEADCLRQGAKQFRQLIRASARGDIADKYVDTQSKPPWIPSITTPRITKRGTPTPLIPKPKTRKENKQ